MHPTPAVALLVAGCTPSLTCPEGQVCVVDPADWTAPDNAWEAAEAVPSGLRPEGYSTGQTVPDLRLRDQNNDEVSLWQFYGNVIAIDVGTFWCAPCQKAAGHIQEIADKYEEDGFVFLSVLPQNYSGAIPSQDDLVDWADRHGIAEPLLSDDIGYSVQIVPDEAWPRLLLIDRDLTVVTNPVTPTDVQSVVEAAIEEVL